MEHDPWWPTHPEPTRHRFEIERFWSQQIKRRSELANLTSHNLEDFILGEMTHRLEAKVLLNRVETVKTPPYVRGERISTVDAPASTWDAVKGSVQDWLVRRNLYWLASRVKVGVRRIETKHIDEIHEITHNHHHVCPHISLDGYRDHVNFLVSPEKDSGMARLHHHALAIGRAIRKNPEAATILDRLTQAERSLVQQLAQYAQMAEACR
jgi:hypothetical protein